MSITAHHSVDVHPPVTWNSFKIGVFQWKELLIINKSFLSKAELKDQCICSFKDLKMSEILDFLMINLCQLLRVLQTVEMVGGRGYH